MVKTVREALERLSTRKKALAKYPCQATGVKLSD
jgi:hypothetical protein